MRTTSIIEIEIHAKAPAHQEGPGSILGTPLATIHCEPDYLNSVQDDLRKAKYHVVHRAIAGLPDSEVSSHYWIAKGGMLARVPTFSRASSALASIAWAKLNEHERDAVIQRIREDERDAERARREQDRSTGRNTIVVAPEDVERARRLFPTFLVVSPGGSLTGHTCCVILIVCVTALPGAWASELRARCTKDCVVLTGELHALPEAWG